MEGRRRREEMSVFLIINKRNKYFLIKSEFEGKRAIHSLEIICCSKYIKIRIIGKRRVRVLLHCSIFNHPTASLWKVFP